MNISYPRLIVFDMDGTLIDSLPDLANSSRYLLKSYNLPEVGDEIVRPMLGDGINRLVQRLLEQFGKQSQDIDLKEATDRFIADYVPHSVDYSKPFEGAIECLKQLKTDGWKIALCTNKITNAAIHILEKLHLDSYFDTVGGGDLFAACKPDPRHLEGIIKAIGTNAARTVMVGDHMNDIRVAENAHAAGSIFAAWGYCPAEIGKYASKIAYSMRDVPALANQLIN